MTYSDYIQRRARIEMQLSEGRIKNALEETLTLIMGFKATAPRTSPAPNTAAMEEELRSVGEGYRMMVTYALQGADDPSRASLLANFMERIRRIVDRVALAIGLSERRSIYYNTMEVQRTSAATIGSLADELRQANNGAHGFDLAFSNMSAPGTRRELERREALGRDLFNMVWVTFPYLPEHVESLRGVLTGGALPAPQREHLLWAVMLGGLEFFDPARLLLLLEVYLDPATSPRLQTAALTSLLLLLNAFPYRSLGREVEARLSAARELPTWEADLRACCMELVKTIDTERIQRKIQDEIVPEMLKIKPQIDRKLDGKIENFDPAEMEENPQWQEMLEKSGIADKLKELSEIQEEGGDVMIGTFAQLKQFGFFHEVANWFLPFGSEFSLFAGEEGARAHSMADVIADAPFLCDNDKFSFMLSIMEAPQAQRRLMMQQFNTHSQQMAQMKAAMLENAATDRRALINTHVQNLYRFFTIFRRKVEFRSPFGGNLDLAAASALRPDILKLDVERAVGEFYFSHGYYPQAIKAFGYLTDTDATLMEKTGYSYEKSGNLSAALSAYSRAALMGSNSDWLLRRRSHTLMQLSRPEEALPLLRELEERRPDNLATAMNIGRCLVELGRYNEATKAYYKAEYLDEKSGKALRPLAWSLLMDGNTADSRRYYEKVIERLEPRPDDYLNMGHLSLAENRVKEAVNFYSLSISLRGGRPEHIKAFLADMAADAPALRRLGVDDPLRNLIVDGLLYTL